jgi:hypothetical protein
MVKPVRVRTTWFKQEGERSVDDVSTVMAANLWRLADKAVDNLSRANYDIVTAQRGFKLIAELTCFMVHYVDRLVYGRIDEATRAELISAIGGHLAKIMEDNILDFTDGVKDPGYDYRAAYIERLNGRMQDYAGFDIAAEQVSFQALRFLSLQIREDMLDSDKSWIQDQIMDIEVPELLGAVKKTVDGFYPSPVGRGQ